MRRCSWGKQKKTNNEKENKTITLTHLLNISVLGFLDFLHASMGQEVWKSINSCRAKAETSELLMISIRVLFYVYLNNNNDNKAAGRAHGQNDRKRSSMQLSAHLKRKSFPISHYNISFCPSMSSLSLLKSEDFCGGRTSLYLSSSGCLPFYFRLNH